MRRRRRSHLFITGAILVGGAAAIGAWWHVTRRESAGVAPGEAREVTVEALWFMPGEAGGESGTSRVVVRVEPAEIPGARVGFFEAEAEGTGETWRASAWMATVVASLTAGIDLQQYVPSFTVEGRIDGPSAGALLAVAVLAGLTDQQLRPHASMTGTIGPDGAVGPVGGIAHKIDAAKQAGIGLVLIPRGQQYGLDAETNRPVDVIAHGEGRGVEVREVEDIAEAYEVLTGHALEQPAGGDQEPALHEEIESDLLSRAGGWLETYRAEMAECDRLLSGMGDAQVDEELAEARSAAARAEEHLAGKNAASAYDQAVAATLQAAAILDVVKALEALGREGVDAAAKGVAPGEDRDAEIGTAAAKISDLTVDTTDGLLATADALGIVAQAAGLLRAREGLSSTLAEMSNEVGAIETVFRAAIIKGLDRHMLPMAQDRAMLVAPGDSPRVPDYDPLSAWAVTTQRAASANLAYFKAVSIDEAARSLGLHPDILRTSMAYQDPTHLLAEAGLAALPQMAEHLSGKRNNDAAILGASVGAYTAGSALVARFYSLQLRVDEEGDIVGVSDEEALDRLLVSSAAKARRSVASARAAGLQATVPTFYYLIGQQYERGDTAERTEALQHYWQAGLYARIGTLIARG